MLISLQKGFHMTKVTIVDDLLPGFLKKEDYSSFKEIPKSLVKKTKKWLRKEGIKHFKDIKEKHHTINAVWNEDGIPHSVHFREGMQVRNFMRDCRECKEWNAHDFDDNWISLIEKVIA